MGFCASLLGVHPPVHLTVSCHSGKAPFDQQQLASPLYYWITVVCFPSHYRSRGAYLLITTPWFLTVPIIVLCFFFFFFCGCDEELSPLLSWTIQLGNDDSIIRLINMSPVTITSWVSVLGGPVCCDYAKSCRLPPALPGSHWKVYSSLETTSSYFYILLKEYLKDGSIYDIVFECLNSTYI